MYFCLIVNLYRCTEVLTYNYSVFEIFILRSHEVNELEAARLKGAFSQRLCRKEMILGRGSQLALNDRNAPTGVTTCSIR